MQGFISEQWATHPVDRRKRHRERVLDIPEHGATEVDVVLNEPHAAVAGPAAFSVEANDVLIVRVWVGREVPLDEVARLVCLEAEEDVDPIDVTSLKRGKRVSGWSARRERNCGRT
jgi:hypothetical protein